MRFMMSYKGINKLMLNGTNYDQIVKFVHENFFLKMSKWTMYYIDSDGDAISLDSQLDVATMMETCDKEHLKIYIKDVDEDSKLVAQEINLQNSTQIQKLQPEITIKDNKPQQNSLQKIQVKVCNLENQSVNEKKVQNNQFNPHGWRNFNCQGRGQWKKKIQQKMARFVDQRVESLIPLITKKVQDRLQKKEESEPKQKIQNIVNHKIKCNQCGIDSIIGIRYKCVKCPLFNICQDCQAKTTHNHNMIKMKHVQEQQKQEQLPQRSYWKTAQRDHFPFPPPPPPYSMNPFGPNVGFPFPPPPFPGFANQKPALFRHDKIQNQQKSCDGRLKVTKKCFKMSQLFGGQPKKYQQFVTNNKDLKFDQMSELYITKTDGVKISQQFTAKGAEKAQKLGFYFNKPSEQFEQIIKKNPASNLKQLIKIYSQRKLNQKSQEKAEQKISQNIIKKQKLQQVTHKKIDEIQPLKTLPPPVITVPIQSPINVPKNFNKINIQKRNQCVLLMKQLFGENDVFSYIQFYNNNHYKKNQEIIEQYIQTITKK